MRGTRLVRRAGAVIADELDVPMKDVEVYLSDARPELVWNQLTGGSTSHFSLWIPVKQAAATLKQSRLNRERMGKLFDEQLIPKSDLETADANLGVADGRYQEALETARTRQALLSQRRSELAIAQQQMRVRRHARP